LVPLRLKPRIRFAGVLVCLLFAAVAGAQAPRTAGSEELPVAPQPTGQGSASAQGTNPDTTRTVTLKGTPKRFLADEVHIFSSPAHVRKGDLKWLLPLGIATGAALATDSYTMRHVVSRNSSFNDAASFSSDVLRGIAIGTPVVMYAAGAAFKKEESREAGLLGGEAMVDAYVFDEVIKYATLRERPKQDDGRGRFYVGSASSDPSFVSGHSVVAWSSAAVLAEEYHRPWQQVGIYTLASGVSLTRVLGQDHFPTDALLGSATGWLIGHYVYRSHHRSRQAKQIF
jgi:hypothetical protein